MKGNIFCWMNLSVCCQENNWLKSPAFYLLEPARRNRHKINFINLPCRAHQRLKALCCISEINLDSKYAESSGSNHCVSKENEGSQQLGMAAPLLRGISPTGKQHRYPQATSRSRRVRHLSQNWGLRFLFVPPLSRGLATAACSQIYVKRSWMTQL